MSSEKEKKTSSNLSQEEINLIKLGNFCEFIKDKEKNKKIIIKAEETIENQVEKWLSKNEIKDLYT